jgi:hypothetical protein
MALFANRLPRNESKDDFKVTPGPVPAAFGLLVEFHCDSHFPD